MYTDKRRAIKRKYRISEVTLWFIAFIGGAAGMTLGMMMFRHKTKRAMFKLGLPLFMIVQLIIVLYVWDTIVTKM